MLERWRIVRVTEKDPATGQTEVVFGKEAYRNVKTTVVTVDADTGKEIERRETTSVEVFQGWGETLDFPSNPSDPIAAIKAHKDYPKKKAKIDKAFTDWQTKAVPVDHTPKDREFIP